MKIIESSVFFASGRPPGIPADAGPSDWASLVSRTRTLDASRHPLSGIRDILVRENTRLGASEPALAFARGIGPETVFVVCGQQAGLFGGPLYTLYKALHAIRLAERLTGETGRNVVPVFWVASDDHDFGEVRSVGVRTGDGAPFQAEYTPSGMIPGTPVGEILLDEGITVTIQSLADRLPRGDRADSYTGILNRTWTPGTRWSEAFSAQMSAMLSPKGLLMLDPRWNGVKALFRDILRAELEHPLDSTIAVNEAGERFGNAHRRRKALRKPENSTNLFLETGGVRQAVIVDNDRFRAGGTVYGRDELLSLLEEAPERFSPGAALRPVCQDALLPVAALIAGPGERVYLEQVRALYPLFGVSGSIPWPRASFTLIDHRALRAAEKEGLPLTSLFRDADRLRTELAAASFPSELGERLDTLEREVGQEFDALTNTLRTLDPTLADSAEKEKGRALHSVESIRERALRAHKARLEVAGSRLDTVRHFLLPESGPQERWFGADAAITVLGPEGLDDLLAAASPGEEFHRLVLPE